jgi:polyhydroxybutyrate depolymerase
MANRLGCDLSDHMAAIGPVSGAYQYGENCSPSQPVAVVAFHGTDDPVIPYNGIGNISQSPPEAYFTIGIPIPQWASTWAGRNACGTGPSIILQNDQATGQQWGDCHSGADVILYTIIGGGHGWPGGMGGPGGEINATRMIRGFCKQHPSVGLDSR